ncbi:MAG TPA: heme-binding domain-containing protein [Pyrinomonadaceae bacterium]|nr:heme-binding domain-containing protein [Pyrinomonadaceae bacterium]
MVKKIILAIFGVLLLAFIVIQFIRPDFTNPPVNAADKIENSMQIPDNVKTVLARSCADCHSNETKYPWYSKIQPSAWFLKDHIDEGRHELNFSIWNTYENRRKKRKLDEICEQIESKEMPLPSYLWIHGDAKMSEEDIKIVCDWAKSESAKIVQ